MLELDIDVVKGFESFVLRDIEEFKRQGFVFKSFDKWEQKEIEKDSEFSKKTSEEKQSLYTQNLIYEYSNLRQRLIPAKPRKIVYAKDFTIIPEYEKGLRFLEEKIRKGDTLTPHLSRKILDADSQDGLLFDFGVYHLHLGEREDSRHAGLIEGREKILYAVFTDDIAFFICIDSHGRWGDLELLRIIQAEFPQVLEKWEMKDVTALTFYPTESERVELRKNGINTPIEINGKYYMSPGGGINTARTSAQGIFQMNMYYHFYQRIDSQIKEFFEKHKNEIAEKLDVDGKLDFVMTNINPMEFEDKKNNVVLVPTIQENNLKGIFIGKVERK